MSPRTSDLKPKTPFAKRLKILLSGKSFSGFESQYGLPNGSIGKYMQGRLPNYDALVTVIQATGCDANWLLLGKGEPFPEK